MTKCPKCGASSSRHYWATHYCCGSRSYPDGFHQTETCRIRELELEVEQLRASLHECNNRIKALEHDMAVQAAKDCYWRVECAEGPSCIHDWDAGRVLPCLGRCKNYEAATAAGGELCTE